MYDFEQQINRLNTDSVKWNALKAVYDAEDILPMWIADMDFASPPEIQEALRKRVDHGLFGYGIASDDMKTAVKDWMKNRFSWEILEEWLLPSSGVVSAIAFSIQALTEEGDKVLIQPPVYSPFYSMISSNNRELVKNSLVLKNGKYEIDFIDFEEKLKTGVKLFILCSPHNPVGRVWSNEELEKIGELCERYGVYIVSDEIHADLIYEPNKHHSIASINSELQDRTITCIAPSKTFNIPGLQASIMIIPNEEIRKKIQNVQEKIAFHGLNIFGNTAIEAAYKFGEGWLEELLVYLKENIKYTVKFIEAELPELNVIQPEGTYLVWIDCRGLGLSENELNDQLIQKGKLALVAGSNYGEEGTGFIRMNIACPRKMLDDALQRLKVAFS